MKTLSDLHRAVPRGGRVLDVGCLGFTQRKLALSLGRADTMHFGVDYCARVEVPDGFVFKRADLDQEGIPFSDDSFDLVVVSHTIFSLFRPYSC